MSEPRLRRSGVPVTLTVDGDVAREYVTEDRDQPIAQLLAVVEPGPDADHATVWSGDGLFTASVPLSWLASARISDGRVAGAAPASRCWLVKDVARIELTTGRVADSLPADEVPEDWQPDVELLAEVDEDWQRALAIVAHPDDLEYGASSAIARWASQGKQIDYLLVTSGEAGIAGVAPAECGPLRRGEQIESARIAGARGVEFLEHRDGMVVPDLALRRDLASAIRRYRPELVLTINHRETWGGSSWNHADHRAVGVAVLDAVRDAGNEWVFPELTDAGEDAWAGVTQVLVAGSPQPTHAVDVSDHLDAGVASLAAHGTYLAALDPPGDPRQIVAPSALATGPRIGVRAAVSFELVS